MLTARELKGFNFEKRVVKETTKFNPYHYPWSKGVDIIFKLGDIVVETECKFSHAKIFESWIKRDWIPRFKLENSIRVVVTNRGIKLSDKAKKLLDDNKILHVYYDKVKGFLEWLWFVFSQPVIDIYYSERVTRLLNLIKELGVYHLGLTITIDDIVDILMYFLRLRDKGNDYSRNDSLFDVDLLSKKIMSLGVVRHG